MGNTKLVIQDNPHQENTKRKHKTTSMNGILISSIVLTILTTMLFISYIVLLFLPATIKLQYENIENVTNFLNAISSVMFGITFGFWVSYIFERENKKQVRIKDEKIIEKIRNQEFCNIKYYLSTLVRDFHMREDQLVSKLNKFDVKCSFSKNDIDVENLTLNYFIFNNIYKNLNKYINKEDLEFIKTNIECMLMKDEMAYVYIDENAIKTSTTFRDFMDFNKECVKLYKRMLQFNLDYQMEVFSEEELTSIGVFAREIGPGYFTNFNPPYEIIQMFEKLKPIEKFLKVDFIPYYKKGTLLSDMEEEDKKQKAFENKIKEWNEKYNAQALKIIDLNTQF